MANTGMIGGGRFSQAERSGDTRKFDNHKVNIGKLLIRLWRYIGKNRLLVVLALLLSFSSSVLNLFGPKLSGRAINAIDLGTGQVDFETVVECVVLMVFFYLSASALSYLLHAVMLKLSRTVSRQMRHDIFEKMTALPVLALVAALGLAGCTTNSIVG